MATYTVEEIMTNRHDWNAALDDESNGQTTGKLADKTYQNFCCLGVAADKVPALACRRSTDGMFDYTLLEPLVEGIEESSDANTVTLNADLPSEVLAKLGLDQAMQTFLIGLNDDAGLNFPTIGTAMLEMPIVGEGHDDEWDERVYLMRNLDLFGYASAAWFTIKLRDALEQRS